MSAAEKVPSHADAVVGYNASSTLLLQVFTPWGTTCQGAESGCLTGHESWFGIDALGQIRGKPLNGRCQILVLDVPEGSTGVILA